MDASNKDRSGEELLSTIVELTGLEEGAVRQELGNILDGAGQPQADVTLEQLRAALLQYLESLNEDFANSESGFPSH
ncbi:MAG: hypothetical protein IT285_14350 [Bdellovibrionales bacterium]|nr:hypothetical protein [Bdellovibrionales bacterium]